MAVAPAHTVHLLERVRRPERLKRTLEASPPTESLIVDLSSGRVDGLSQVKNEEWGTPSRIPVIDNLALAPYVAESSRKTYVRWISAIADRKLINNKSIKKLFTYNNEISLWWVTKTSQKEQVSSPIRWLFFIFETIDHLINSGKVAHGATWHLWTRDEYVARALSQAIANRGRVIIHDVDRDSKQERSWRNIYRAVWTPLQHIARALYLTVKTRRQRQSIVQRSQVGTDESRTLLVTEFPRSWKISDSGGGTKCYPKPHDLYFGSMPLHLQKDGHQVAWLTTSPSWSIYKQWKRKAIEQQTIPDVSETSVITPITVARLLLHQMKWAVLYVWVFRLTKCHNKIRYINVNLGHWIQTDYLRLCTGTAVATMLTMERYRSCVKAMRPTTVLYRDEMYISGRTVSAALKGRVRLIGIQHGIINRESTVYCFDKKEIHRGDGRPDHIKSCPVPDEFATFGTFVKDLFERWDGFDPRKVVPVGGARHDDLVRQFLTNGSDRESLRRTVRRRLGLPIDRPIVILCTQKGHDAHKWFEMVLGAVRASGSDPMIIVKTHHYGGGSEEIKSAAHQHNFDDYVIRTDDVYSLMFASDLIVCGQSTIALESLLLDRPVICIGNTVDYETYPFAEDNIARFASNQDEMNTLVQHSLLGLGGVRELSERRSKSLKRHLWNYDGRATHRISMLMDPLCASHPEGSASTITARKRMFQP